VTDLIQHMSQAQIDASEIIDKSDKPIIDPKNNKKMPQQGTATVVCYESSTEPHGRRLLRGLRQRPRAS
jgi:hypothetical protein